MAAVTALAVSLVIGGAAAFADAGNEHQCKDHRGRGEMSGQPGNGKGRGISNGLKKCREDGGNTGGGSTTDTGNDGDPVVDVTIDVDVTLPNVPVSGAVGVTGATGSGDLTILSSLLASL